MNLKKPFSMTIFGRPGQGKSSLIKYIMSLNHPDFAEQPFRYGIVMCNTAFNKGYDYLPGQFVHDEFDVGKIRALIDIQKSTGGAHAAFVVLDDCLDKKGFEDEILKRLVTQFRHYNISFILATQYPTLIPTYIRNCCTHVAIFRETNGPSLAAIYNGFGMAFGSREDFQSYLMGNTGDHRFIFRTIDDAREDVREVYAVMKVPAGADMPVFTYNYG